MDYSKYPFSTEGCSSSESGWTMYIDSPMQEDDMDCYNEDYDNNDRKSNHNHGIYNEDNKEDSDDSMASDASSGPSHHQHKRPNEEGSHGMSSSKHGKSDPFKKLFSWKKSNEKEKKGEHSSKQKHKADAHKKYFK
ncbi:acidic leucine-rich nuclear phosphoprotein 32 family member B-like [Melia azedarach]|uniref:Acidic leucine-rich nuclear phosphoprotein 32 family member B-like n=1 Tax=Melia azedarach TaxID=155640 RepID=A0ACC1X7Q8_MELAZ|nr:acidic leucine-rich nuclear phosphoprotein 32 family member B-like [Melia azedarach]